jgi:nitrate/nitrite transport system substrate-binding protein
MQTDDPKITTPGPNPAPGRDGIWVGGGDGPEKTCLRFGIIPLTDCAVIAVAAERGYFSRHGLQVEVSREGSWASIRDKVAVGELDAAQMLAGMPIAETLGIGTAANPQITAFSMDLNGNGITVSNDLYQRMLAEDPMAMRARPLTARALQRVIARERAAGKPPMSFAMVYPFSSHNYALRYWMAAAGIDPDRDVRITVIPPPHMVDNLAAGNIDGYCVGEPWNSLAVSAGVGHTLITDYEIWNNNPEKVLGVNLEWAERYPNTHRAAIMALLEAAQWMDDPDNRGEVARLLTGERYAGVPEEILRASMTGTFRYAADEPPQPLPDFNVFHRFAANFPWRSHAQWFITQMYRWGQLDRPLDIKAAAAEVYRTDLYRDAAQALGIPYPTVDHKTEGGHAQAWRLQDASAPIMMGPDRFFDGGRFDPQRPVEYLGGFDVHHLAVSLEALREVNP